MRIKFHGFGFFSTMILIFRYGFTGGKFFAFASALVKVGVSRMEVEKDSVQIIAAN